MAAPKKGTTMENIIFVIIVLIGIWVLSESMGEQDPGIKHVPPSVPTDVGTLTP